MKRFGLCILLLLVILSGCGGGSGETCTLSEEQCEYYTGSRGVRMDPTYAPDELIYHSRDIPDENAVDIEYTVENVGASASFGALYIAGLPTQLFDLFRVDGEGNELLITGGQACDLGFNIGLGGSNPLGFLFGSGATSAGCDLALGWNENGGYGYVGIQTLLRAFGGSEDLNVIFDEMGIPRPEGQIGYNTEDGLTFDASIGLSYFDIFPHGIGILSIMSKYPLGSLNGNVFVLEGDTPHTPGGEQQFRAFRVKLPNWPVGQDTMEYDYEVRACYAYTTFVSPEICIDTRPRENVQGKICNADRSISLGTQGAPVAITQMRQETNRRSIQLWFTIENVGGGRVVNLDNFMACSPYYSARVKERDLYDTVYLPKLYVGNQPDLIECNSHKIRLQNGKAEIRCSYDLTHPSVDNVDTGYTLPLEMELWYGYQMKDRRRLYAERIG